MTFILNLVFGKRSPRLVYYGPHQCAGCRAMICKTSIEQGGDAYDYPGYPIYPNSVWRPHDCSNNGASS